MKEHSFLSFPKNISNKSSKSVSGKCSPDMLVTRQNLLYHAKSEGNLSEGKYVTRADEETIGEETIRSGRILMPTYPLTNF